MHANTLLDNKFDGMRVRVIIHRNYSEFLHNYAKFTVVYVRNFQNFVIGVRIYRPGDKK